VVDKSLRLLPQRETDGAYMLRNFDAKDGGDGKKLSYKFNLNMDREGVLVRRCVRVRASVVSVCVCVYLIGLIPMFLAACSLFSYPFFPPGTRDLRNSGG
jgi:hypothetical protein